MFRLTVIFLSLLSGLGLVQPSPVADVLNDEVNTSLSRRDIVVDFSDYACGAKVFCNSSLASYKDPYCYDCKRSKCDDTCAFYGDCCPDLLYEERTDLPIPPSPYISCRRQHPRSYSFIENPYVFMVSSCPKTSATDRVTKSKCEQPSLSSLDESTPVSVDATKIAYRNAHCANCHQQSGYVQWRLEVKCSRSDFLSSASDKDELWSLVVGETGCSIKNFPPNHTGSRECYGGLNDQCNSTGKWEKPNKRIEELCQLYYSPVTFGYVTYKNIFCSICDGMEFNRESLCNQRRERTQFDTTAPLSVLIDFNPKPRFMSTPPAAKDTVTKCNDTELYDPISKTCRRAKCSSGRLLSDGECEVMLETIAGVGYSSSVALTFSEDLSLRAWRELLRGYDRYLRSALEQYTPFLFSRMEQTLYTTSNTTQDYPLSRMNISGAILEFDFLSTSKEHILGFENTLRDLLSDSSNFTFANKSGILTSIPVHCSSSLNKILEGHPGKIFRYSDEILSLCKGIICDFSLVIYRPILSIMNCPHLEFKLSEHNLTFVSENSSMIVSNQTIYLTESKYWICDDVIRLCSSELERIEQLIIKSSVGYKISAVSVSPAMTMVSLVCIVLSLICLMLTFIVYCLLPQLRTLPGKNTMILVAYLFLAQLFFQIGIRLTHNSRLCRAMGVLIHYLWIASFTTMATCAFHMYTVFTQMSAKPFHNRLEETKKLIHYIFISNFIAAIVIGICIGYNAGVSQGAEIGYGGDICFLKSPTDIGIFFAAPLGMVLALNIYWFIRVAHSIRQVPEMKTTKNQANRNHAAVYFRLSILLGFTWIFGFVAAVLQLEFLWYIFIILNGLQGVFIFVGYCLNRRILNMLRARCCGSTSDKYRSSGQSTETISLRS